MSRITINSNLAALQVGRHLDRNTGVLRQSFERLSSGLRINRASDDAAGLSVASGLEVDSRVFSQGVRNLNDGIGLLNVADGSLSELSDIVIRIRELATQAANGSLSYTQRRALDEEAQELNDEFTRIVQTTEFNGLSLLGREFDALRLQAGYGSSGGIESTLGGSIGDRTFTSSSPFATVGAISDTLIFDANGDGNNDVVAADALNNQLYIQFGDGQGGFSGEQTIGLSASPSELEKADFNNDGIFDLALIDSASSSVVILLGDGAGGFSRAGNVSSSGSLSNLRVGDFNADGEEDLAWFQNGATIQTSLGNGDGTFQALVSTINPNSNGFEVADINGDGRDEVIARRNGTLRYYSSNDSGALTQRAVAGISTGSALGIGDIDGDGLVDVIIGTNTDGGSYARVEINADGSFGTEENLGFGASAGSILVADLDGDGYSDIAAANPGDDIYVVGFGDGAGQFEDTSEINTGLTPSVHAVGDLNGDGLLDIMGVETNGDFNMLLSNSVSGTAAIQPFSLETQADALASMSVLDAKLASIAEQRGAIGAFISRVGTGISNLSVASTNYTAAKSRITDVDVASEAATLARSQILQQASAAILSQANSAPALALDLLSGI